MRERREIRDKYKNDEIDALLTADLLILLKADTAGRVDSGDDNKLGRREQIALMRLLTQQHKNGPSPADDPANDALPSEFFQSPSNK